MNKGITSNKLKKHFKIKLTIVALIFLMPILMVFLLMFLIIQSSQSNTNPILIAKALDIPAEYLTLANRASRENGIQFSFFLTLSAEAANYTPESFTAEIIDEVLKKAKSSVLSDLDSSSKEIYNIYSKYYDDIKAGPIAKAKIITTKVPKQSNDKNGKPSTGNSQPEYGTTSTEIQYKYSHYDDFGAERTFGGDRAHEGNDLVADRGVPIVSITDGVVRDMNWNDFGGNIVGVLTDKDTYFYYAHMQSFNTALHEGDRVKVGDVLGYVGNTGYGPPGTSGMFITHCHLQIGIKLDGQKERFYINPYNIVKYLDEFRVTLQE